MTDENRFPSLSMAFWKLHRQCEGNANIDNIRLSQKTNIDRVDADRFAPSQSQLIQQMDKYPSCCSRYISSVPLSRMSQIATVHVQSSTCWKTGKYAMPKRNPSFRQISSLLKEPKNQPQLKIACSKAEIFVDRLHQLEFH